MSTFGRGFSRHDIFLTLWSSFNVLLLLTLLHPLRKLMINSAKLSKSIAKFLSYASLILIINTFLLYSNLIFTPVYTLFERNDKIYHMSVASTAALYALQNYLMLLNLYLRLYFVFKTSMWAISKHTTLCFISIFILLLICCIAMVLLPTVRHTFVWRLLIVFFVVIVSTLYISLVTLLVHKLYKAHSPMHSTDDSLLPMIHKNTLLAIVSVVCTCLGPVSVVIRFRADIMWMTFLSNCLVSIDIYIKLCCVMLSYSFYQWHYQKACGCIESVCCKRSITEHPEVHSHMEYKRSDAEHPELPVEVTTETAESKEIELSHRNRRNAISVTA
eukprot:534467_1